MHFGHFSQGKKYRFVRIASYHVAQQLKRPGFMLVQVACLAIQVHKHSMRPQISNLCFSHFKENRCRDFALLTNSSVRLVRRL